MKPNSSTPIKTGDGSQDPTKGKHDMWHDHKPGIDIVPEIFYSANFYTTTAVGIVNNHTSSTKSRTNTAASTAPPLWLHLAYQNVHSPYVNPPDWECHAFPKMWDAVFANMLHLLDDGTFSVFCAFVANPS